MSQAESSTQRLELLLLGGTLLVHGVVTLLAHRPDLIWDEGRYLWFAKNLTQGFYLTPRCRTCINGPGYPLVLAPMLLAEGAADRTADAECRLHGAGGMVQFSRRAALCRQTLGAGPWRW
jgi:hypothetical protein